MLQFGDRRRAPGSVTGSELERYEGKPTGPATAQPATGNDGISSAILWSTVIGRPALRLISGSLSSIKEIRYRDFEHHGDGANFRRRGPHCAVLV